MIMHGYLYATIHDASLPWTSLVAPKTSGMIIDMIQHCNLARRHSFSTAIILLPLVNHCWDVAVVRHSIKELWRPCVGFQLL